MTNPVGESNDGVLRLDFDRRLRLQFRGSVVTSDAGLLAYRELDDALGLTDMASEVLVDARTGKNGRHALAGLFRQAVFGRLAGYEDVNDAGRLRHDPAMRWVVGGRAALSGAASASQMGRFETRWLTAEKNLTALADLSGRWIDRVHSRRPPRGILLDMDSSVSPTTHGEQENSCWNGHYECTCYHPLFLFNQFGDLERCALRPGNVHSADGWEGVLKPVVARYKGQIARIYFRGDAGFANPDIYDYLEAEGVKYVIRLPANRVLQERIGHLLTRPVGRPPHEVRRFYASFSYRAGSWTRPRRVVGKVEWHPGELYPRVGFIVTNLARAAESVVAFYNKRGTCEQWIKEGNGAINWTRLSCRSFTANAVRLQLHALAYNLGNFLRALATPEPMKDWSLTTLKEKLIKIGAKVVSHGRYGNGAYVSLGSGPLQVSLNTSAGVYLIAADAQPSPTALGEPLDLSQPATQPRVFNVGSQVWARAIQSTGAMVQMTTGLAGAENPSDRARLQVRPPSRSAHRRRSSSPRAAAPPGSAASRSRSLAWRPWRLGLQAR